MNHTQNRRLFVCCGISVTATLILSIAAQIFLRNLYRLLSFDEQFCAIFAQISSADIVTPALTLLFSSLIITLLVSKIRRRPLAILICVIGAILLTPVSILLSRVNGIMFADVLATLIPLLESGAL